MKTLSINDLVEQEKGQIWVLNNSNEQYASGADVFVTLTMNGQSSLLTIPRTWLPIDITARFPRKVILESQYFVEALSSGLLKAIPADVALKMLQDSGAQKERDRLRLLEDAVAAAGRARGISKNVLITTGDMEKDEEAASIAASQQQQRNSDSMVSAVNAAAGLQPQRRSVTLGGDDEDEDEGDVDDGVEPGFKAWVDKVNAIGDEDEARGEVKMRGNMQIAEAQYLVEKCVHQSIVTSLAKKLQKLDA